MLHHSIAEPTGVTFTFDGGWTGHAWDDSAAAACVVDGAAGVDAGPHGFVMDIAMTP